MSLPSRVSLLVLASGLLAAACNPFGVGDCTDELGMRVQPVDPVVRPGESFVATLELSTCGGEKRWRPAVVWRAADTLVVRVDSLTGRVTGRATGATEVMPFERRADGYEVSYVPVRVRVEP